LSLHHRPNPSPQIPRVSSQCQSGRCRPASRCARWQSASKWRRAVLTAEAHPTGAARYKQEMSAMRRRAEDDATALSMGGRRCEATGACMSQFKSIVPDKKSTKPFRPFSAGAERRRSLPARALAATRTSRQPERLDERNVSTAQRLDEARRLDSTSGSMSPTSRSGNISTAQRIVEHCCLPFGRRRRSGHRTPRPPGCAGHPGRTTSGRDTRAILWPPAPDLSGRSPPGGAAVHPVHARRRHRWHKISGSPPRKQCMLPLQFAPNLRATKTILSGRAPVTIRCCHGPPAAAGAPTNRRGPPFVRGTNTARCANGSCRTAKTKGPGKGQ
jgi:hypothetical protein